MPAALKEKKTLGSDERGEPGTLPRKRLKHTTGGTGKGTT